MVSVSKSLSFIFALLVIVSFTSCEKTFQSELIGTWKLETLGDSTLEKLNATWTFNDDNTVVISNSPSSGNSVSVTGYYSVDSKWVVTPLIFIEGFGESLDGNYEVDELSSSLLKMSRYELLDTAGNFITDGANLRKEFYKK